MSPKTLKYAVIAALALNAAALIFFWLGRPPRRREGPPQRVEQIVIDELRLDKYQQEVYGAQHREHHRLHDSLLQLIAAQRRALYSQKGAVSDSILQKIGFLQQEIERVTYAHFMDVRKICSPAQQKALDSLLDKTVQNLLMPRREKRENK